MSYFKLFQTYFKLLNVTTASKFRSCVDLKNCYMLLIILFSNVSSIDHSDETVNDLSNTNSVLPQNEKFLLSNSRNGHGAGKKGLKSKLIKSSCEINIAGRNSSKRINQGTVDSYDTLTQSDVVRNQYSTLPFPAVTLEDLNVEKAYYDNKQWPVRAYGEIRNKPFRVTPGVTLEAINHFVYNGKNNFRYDLRFENI